MARVIFLSESTLKQESVLQDNADMKVITPTIFDVQNMYILPILGTALYNDLCEKLTADVTLATEPNYKSLLDLYITPAMVWWMRFELPMNLNYKYFSTSVGTQGAANLTPLTESEMFKLMDHTKNKAEWYCERLTKYLLANPAFFPLYLNQPNAGIDTIFAKRTNFNSGMVLGDDGCCKGSHNFQNIRIEPTQLRGFGTDC